MSIRGTNCTIHIFKNLNKACKFTNNVRQNSNTSNFVKVADKIKKIRNAALLGGGEKRIDAQHKKVSSSFKFSKTRIFSRYLISRLKEFISNVIKVFLFVARKL